MAKQGKQDYTLVRDDEGRLDLILRESDRQMVRQNDADADYQAVVAWAGKQKPPVDLAKYIFPKNHVLLKDKAAFIDYCKKAGFRLLAAKNELSGNWRISAIEPASNNYGMGPMIRLHEAAATEPGGSGFDGITAKKSQVWVTEPLFNELFNDINDKSENETQRVSTKRFLRTFVYIDVSGFSELPAGQEALVINSLIQILGYKSYWNVPEWFEYAFCIGDGYIFVFKNAFSAVRFAAQLARLIDVFVAKRLVPVKFHFRMGVHTGLAYSFYDIGREGWNYIGDAINGGSRVLAAVGKDIDDVVYISDEVRNAIIRESDATTYYREFLSSLTNKGRHKDKHGHFWRVYEVNYVNCTTLHPDLELSQ